MKIMKFILFYHLIILVTSINQQDFNGTVTNTSNEVNEEQSPKIIQQTTDAIKKAKD